jgi:lathosterol oxidase
MSWIGYVGISVAVSLVTFYGLGGLVHWRFYLRRRAQAADWKLQPERWLGPAQTRQAIWLGGANIVMGAVIGGTLAWHVARGGWSMIYLDAGRHGWWYLPVSFVLTFFLVDAGLYYSHRLLHHRTVFRYIHRWHHRFVAPIVFTTTAVHPIEFLIFEAFLILPAFILPVHAGVYVAVVAYTYLIGMIDHCGIRVRWGLPFHADNAFHDNHHVYFHCNYAHHTPLFDRLHGTVHKPHLHYDEHTWNT